MKKAEQMVLLKLRKYQEKANRDRFNQPLDDLLSHLTNIVCLKLGNKFNQSLQLHSSIKILKINFKNLYLIEKSSLFI